MKYLTYEENFLIDNNGFATAKEICQQPRIWREAVENIIQNQATLTEFMEKVLAVPNLRIILTGAGSSAFIGEMVMPYLNKHSDRITESIATTDLVGTPYYYYKKEIPTLQISYARSGNSPESVAASSLGQDLVDEFYEIIITCNAEGKLAQMTDNGPKRLLLLMPEEAHDEGFAMTSSYSSMAISTLAIFQLNKLQDFKKDVNALSTAVESFILKESEALKAYAAYDFTRYITLGSGMLRGLSRECALKMLELTAGRVNANYDTPLAFRHGPKSAVNNKTLTLFFLSADPYTLKYDVDLVKELYSEKKEDMILVVGNHLTTELESLCDHAFDVKLPDFALDLDAYLPFAYLSMAQIFAFNKSLHMKITPDNPCPTGLVNRVVQGVTIHPYTAGK